MKVCTWNVNGIRAREAQVAEWLDSQRPEVLCLQEIKASPESVPASLCQRADYWCCWHGHKGYSGVGINLRRDLSPEPPAFFHPAYDVEHRVAAVRLGELLVVSLYVPNGGKDFDAKLRFLDGLLAFVREERARGTTLLLCGDLNVALEERDVHPTMRKPGQVGTTAQERALLQALLDEDLVDLHRRFHPDDDRLFTWWAPWRNFRQKNYGWRIDYLLASGPLAARALGCEVFREFGTSDHGPLMAELAAPAAPDPARVPPAEEA
jgi:exodeoxyribonuclease-3